jgi:hypothetical protein
MGACTAWVLVKQTTLVRCAHSWDTMFNTRNISGISAHPCIILYLSCSKWWPTSSYQSEKMMSCVSSLMNRIEISCFIKHHLLSCNTDLNQSPIILITWRYLNCKQSTDIFFFLQLWLSRSGLPEKSERWVESQGNCSWVGEHTMPVVCETIVTYCTVYSS